MKKSILLIATMIFFMAGEIFAGSVITQRVVNACGFIKGSTTLKLSGQLNDAAKKSISDGKAMVVYDSLDSYLTFPTVFQKTKAGYGGKSGTQNVSVNTKNGKFKWTEKDVTPFFTFATGEERIPPTKAVLKTKGTVDTSKLAELETKKLTVFDKLCFDKGLGYLASLVIDLQPKGKNYKFSCNENNLKAKVSVNSKGKVTAKYTLSSEAAYPAILESEDINDDPVVQKDYMVVDLTTGDISYFDDVPEGGWTDEYKTTKIVLKKVEAGTFTMGSPEDELGRDGDEDQHEVTLTKDFYIAVFQTTQKQYETITGSNPSYYSGDTRPVECVSYNMIRGTDKGAGWPANSDVDEDSFLGKLRTKTSKTFDLPTEAQWEFACRAATTTALNNGTNLTNVYEDGNMNKLGRYYYNGSETDGTANVGSYLPNAWGLYDMHGNVWEWCLDWWDDSASWSTDPVTDPVGSTEGTYRLVRGGSYNNDALHCRSAVRDRYDPSIYNRDLSHGGFRVALTLSNDGGDDDDPDDGPTFPEKYMVVDLASGGSSYLDDRPEGGWTDEYKTTKMVLRKVEAGTFTMGSPEDELGRDYWDEVQHEVTLTKDFYIGVFEITQKQYETITGSNPSVNKGDMRPVDCVSFNTIRGMDKGAGWPANSDVDETSFLGKLRAKTNKDFDLPTEAQWEYACRAGTTTALNNGTSLTNVVSDGNLNKLGRYSYNSEDGKGGYFSGSTTVGSYLPNAWGLYDMHGNVWEWCLDWFGSYEGDATDPKGPTEGTYRIQRGYVGGGAHGCRSASRNDLYDGYPDRGTNYGGFRVVLVP